MRRVILALVAGTMFGAGLAISGMADPMRVRGFLDVLGHWDPTLAFVMVGALLPTALAWQITRRRAAPFADDKFHLPQADRIDASLLAGAALFGIGWGIAGLCPGPAIADLAIRPIPAAIFVLAMIGGFGLHRLVAAMPARPSLKGSSS